jgi:CelD/BcsL family acetyltransferase involved in cellulose biosynthesis
MVDAVQSFHRTRAAPISRAAGVEHDPAITVFGVSGLAAYAAVAGKGICAPAQGAPWVRQWTESVQPDLVVATLSRSGETVFALALEVVRKGPFRVARFLGGTHANGNFSPADKAWLGQASARADIEALIGAIAKTRPDIDLVALERLLPDLDGFANPLLAVPHSDSPNISLAVDLDGGFTALLARSSGKRKRKKHRSQTRKFEAAGGFRRIEATTPDEVRRVLGAFFSMKEVRFRKAGIRNVFGDDDVKAFFENLFVGALGVSPRPFVLHALEVGGRIRAVTGSSRSENRIICEFGAIIEDELAHASPGDFLFFDNIREACDEGLAVYDYSVGDELYKRLWCDIETQHLDALAPLTVKGRALALTMRLQARLKAFIKGSPLIWKLTKRLRRRAAGQAAPIEAGEDQD